MNNAAICANVQNYNAMLTVSKNKPTEFSTNKLRKVKLWQDWHNIKEKLLSEFEQKTDNWTLEVLEKIARD